MTDPNKVNAETIPQIVFDDLVRNIGAPAVASFINEGRRRFDSGGAVTGITFTSEDLGWGISYSEGNVSFKSDDWAEPLLISETDALQVIDAATKNNPEH